MDTSLTDRLRRLTKELAGIADHAATATSSDDPSSIAESAVTRFLDLVDAGDLDALEQLVHPDVVYLVPGRSRASGVYEGPDALRRAMSVLPRPGVTDLGSKLTDLLVGANSVVTFHELTGTTDGARHTIELVLRFDVEDGRIARIAEFSADQYATDNLFT